MPIFNGRPVEPGVWYDGHAGHYVQQYVVVLALDAGWDNEEARELAELFPFNTFDDDTLMWDAWSFILDEAQVYLDSVTKGGRWEWIDGEFFLTEVEP